LYEELTSASYFMTNPEKVRNLYLAIGLVLAVIGGWLTQYGWFALPVIGLMIAAFSRWLPKRTLEGSEALWNIKGFREFLHTAERYRLQWQEKEKIFETFLPYAMVLGVAKEWANTFKDIALTPPSWYTGSPGSTFNAIVFWSAMNSFTTTTTSAMTSHPQTSGGSGLGGGGFSGGGFGGGGGGSW
jgi:uncharacterized membrane protein